MTLDELVEQATQLPPDLFNELIDRLMVKCHSTPDPDVELAWKNEVRDRVNDIIEGKVEGIPLEEALTRAARRLP